MKERFLITQTLLSSWQYLFDCYEGCEEAAMEDFLKVLRREPTVQTPKMLDGIEFEAECYALADGKPFTPVAGWENGVRAVARRIRGGQFQVRASRELELDGMTFLCYGILDCLKAGTISDIKKKSKSFGSLELAGSYRESAQHPMYFYLVPEARLFRYLVSDGEELYTEDYRPGECRHIAVIIREFIASLSNMGLLETYKENWKARI